MRVHSLVLNNFTNDVRVHKEAVTLAAAGHDVTVVALWQQGLPLAESGHGYRVHRLRLRTRTWRGGRLAPLFKYLEFAYRVMRFAGQHPADVFHANDANTLPAAWLAMRRFRVALVYDAHELETGRNFGNSTLAGFYQRFWSLPERLLIRKADAVITVCESIADALVQLYGISRPTVVINCPEKREIVRSNRLREELRIPPDLRIVLYQGAVASGRGLEPFLDAVQDVSGVAAVVLGDGPLLQGLRERAQSGALERVFLPGKVPLSALADYTASADIGITTIQATCRSYYYALPNKLFEYIHAGLPVVGSDLPEIARVIRSFDVGEVVDPDDSGAIADALRRLLDDRRYREARANTRRAAEIYNWQHESAKLLALYAGLNA